MSARLRKQINYLKILHKSNPKTRNAILQNADKELINCICECVENTLNGNVKVSPAQRKQLKKHAAVLRQIRAKSGSLQTKKKLLVQKGGFLPALLAPILAGLASTVLGGLIK